MPEESIFILDKDGSIMCTFCTDAPVDCPEITVDGFQRVIMPLCRRHKNALERQAQHQEQLALKQHIGI